MLTKIGTLGMSLPACLGMLAISQCNICSESLKFYSSLDNYFHFLRHYNEKRILAKSHENELSPRKKQENKELVAELKKYVIYFKCILEEYTSLHSQTRRSKYFAENQRLRGGTISLK